MIGAGIAVGFAHILRGPGGGASGTRAAQGTLGTLWWPRPIGTPTPAPDGPEPGRAGPAWRPARHGPAASLASLVIRPARLGPTAQLGPAARAAAGKAARRAVPRAAHAAFEPKPDRPDPISLLLEQGASRVAELLPIRYGRMLGSPLAYYRGAALPMAADLARTPATGLTAQLCGDAHLCNFGIFASPERRLVFDINDFDETLAGPWEWDVKRLVASLEIAGRDNQFTARQRRRIVTETAGHYRLAMRRLAGLGSLDVWYASGELDELAARYRGILSEQEQELAGTDLTAPGRGAEHVVASLAGGDDEMRSLAHLVTMRDGEPRIVSTPPLVVPVADLPGRARLAASLRRVVTGYRQTMTGRPAVPPQPVLGGRHGAQGIGHRQRRVALLDRAAHQP